MSETARDDQIRHLGERLRDLLNDAWDCGVQIIHTREADEVGPCRGDYLLRAREDDTPGLDVRWYPLVEKWGTADA